MTLEKMQLTNFVLRQFSGNFIGTRIRISNRDFETEINKRNYLKVLDGYAPFCKLFFFDNWMPDVKSGTFPITKSNESRLVTAYVQRTRSELPVLERWFDGISAPTAKYLVVVAYTKEQLLKEEPCESITSKYGVVAILGQMSDFEEPASPITMMRNALGVKEGGSDFPIDRKKYLISVEFWSRNAKLKN